MDLTNAGDYLARRFAANASHDDGLEGLLRDKMGIDPEPDPDALPVDEHGRAVRQPAIDPLQGSGNLGGPVRHEDPLLVAFRDLGII